MAGPKEIQRRSGERQAGSAGIAPAGGTGGALTPWNRAWFWRNELAALVLFASVLVLRAPWVLVLGRFRAEEATVYFSYAWTHSFWDALTATHLGYYNFVANIAGVFAAAFPLEWAPRVTTAIALLVTLIPAALILFSSIPGLAGPMRKAVALALLLVVPANPELFLTSITSHFVLCTATGLILVSTHDGRAGNLSKYILLGLAGLTGVVSTFLLPLFCWQWWKERRRERLIQVLVLGFCALLQLVAVSRGMEQGERNFRVNPAVITGAVYLKLIVAPVAPVGLTGEHANGIYQIMAQGGGLPGWIWVVTAAAIALFLIMCWRSGNQAALLLAFACLWISLLASPGSREARSDQALLNHLTGAIRYYYAPQFFLFLALLVSLAPGVRLSPVLKSLGSIWLGAALIMGTVDFIAAPIYWPQMFFGPPWGPQVQEWRKDPSKPLEVWPAPWQVNLPPKP